MRPWEQTIKAAKLINSVLYNYAGAIVYTFTGFVLTPILIRHLGHGSYGAYALIAAILGYTSLMDFGIGLATMRAVAERAHLEDRDELNRIVTNSLLLFVGLGVFLMSVGVALSFFVQDLFKLHGVTVDNFRLAFLVLVAAVAVTFPSGIYSAINQGFGEYGFQNLLNIVQSLLVFGISITIVLSGGGIVGLAVANAGLAVLSLVVKALYASRHYRLALRLSYRSRSQMASTIRLSSYIFLSNLIVTIIFNTDNVVIGSVLGTVAVASYSVALGPANAVRQVGDQFNSVSLSAAASLRAQDRTEELQRLLLESTRMTAVVVFPFVVFLAGWGRELLRVWVGTSFESSYWTLVILSIGMMATCVQGTASQVVIAMHRQRTTALISIAEAACNLTFSIILAKHIGIVGVAIGTTVPTCITAFGVSLPFAAHLVGLPFLRLYKRLGLPVTIAVGAFMILHFVLGGIRFPNWIILGVAALPVVLICIAAGILLDGAERSTYIGYLRGRRTPRESRRVRS